MVRKTNFTIPKEDGVEVVSDPKKTKRRLRTTGKEVPIHSSGKSGSDTASGSRRQTDGQIQAQASRHPPHGTEESHTLHFTETQEDALQDLPADEGHPQSYVCARALLYVITTLMVSRHLWMNGLISEADISTSYWKWRDSPSPQTVPCVQVQWRSSAPTALVETTFAGPAAFKLTSDPHSIGWPAGLGHISHQYLSTHLISSYALDMMVNHVRLQ
jgi:hypothetical protein